MASHRICVCFILYCSAGIVSAGIVEQHNGSIGVLSSGERGSGSVFFLELQATERLNTPTNSEETQSISASVHSIEDFPIASSFRALVVDDSALNRKMMLNVISKFATEIVQV